MLASYNWLSLKLLIVGIGGYYLLRPNRFLNFVQELFLGAPWEANVTLELVLDISSLLMLNK